MYKIRFLLGTIILLASINTSLNAQLKVKDRSEKKQPAWILSQEEGFIVLKEKGRTEGEARSKAIESVKEKIRTDAINLMNTNTYLKSLELDEGTILDLFEGTNYYMDINAENSNSFYWEFILNKKTKEESYDYYIKYPYKQDDLGGVVQQIVDVKISKELEAVEQKYKDFNSIEDLSNVWKDLMYLSPYISDESVNKAKNEALMQNLESTFNKIEIVAQRHIPRMLAVYLIIDEKALDFSQAPKLISDCAEISQATNSNKRWNIIYKHYNCSSAKPLTFTLEFDAGFKKISKEFEINTKDEVVDAKLSDMDLLIMGKQLRFYVSTRYKGNLIVERIVVRYNDLNFTDTPMRQVLDGPGLYDITFSLPPDFGVVKVDETVRGELHYRTEKTGKTGVCKFYNHPIKRQ